MEKGPLPSLPKIAALRDSFGDNKPPDITRKITAWKHTMTHKLRRLERIIDRMADALDLQDLCALADEEADLPLPRTPFHHQALQGEPHPHDSADREHLWEVTVDPHCEPASIPASCISEVRSPGSAGPPAAATPTLVSKGVLSQEEAEILFGVYRDRLDHLLYRILGDHTDLASVVASSSLLTAAVCTVAALHSVELGHLYERCYRELRHLVSAHMLSRQHSVDDVRGLCIGAFWLNGPSWALVGAAVRIASEIELHHAIYKALEGDRTAYMRTRLYYLVYVCDHHSSVLYGRPPMSHECESIKAAMEFLDTEHATEDDVRLVTQVKIWSISGQVFDYFGVDVSKPLAPAQLPQLRRFSISLDTWYADWSDRFGPNANVGNYPAKGVGLHFHFAKLYLCSHAFRGVHNVQTGEPRRLSPELEEVANTAVLCASSILGVMTADAEMQSFLNGLPLCFDMMIAFSVVFLLKVATKYPDTVWMDKSKVFDLVTQTVRMLQSVSSNMHDKHLLVSIAKGLDKLVHKLQDPTTPNELHVHGATAQDPVPHPTATVGHPPMQDDMEWVQSISSFDFFNLQTPLPELDSWPLDLEFDEHGHQIVRSG
ncbi:hypothetical protein PLIIFM63780_005329 [Purpureocillium lilacinum]|nr:hypothetical protein PLIIFM63780_005329 [Purpureocillium lilacinum]